ncbi:MAG: hypothetical protein JW901_05220 [Dehalococcoidia bacterium]|nr:hypothetical protein [Dehalococcoidia bacterium]
MKVKIVHPLWTHLPALLLILAAVFFTVKALPLPDPAPVRFDLSGQPNTYGSPWIGSSLLLGLSVGFLILWLWLDELWARQEKKKTFNWMSLFDEFAIGSMCGVQIAYVNMLASPQRIFPFPWIEMVTACLLGTGLAVVLELIRPYRHYEKKPAIENASQVAEEITRIVQEGQPVSYWESQNPPYVGALMVIVPLIMIMAAVFTWASLPWLSIMLGLIAVAMIGTYGGFRTQVTRDTVTVRMGLLGIRLLQLKTADITGVEVHSFSPLQDFGGYGIRFNSEIRAFYLQGDRGVKITVSDGKKYLIGSDRPEHLAAVIDLVRG